jgi:hypothetical protein
LLGFPGTFRLNATVPPELPCLRRDDDLPSSVSGVEVADRLGDVSQRVASVDDRGDLVGFDELLESNTPPRTPMLRAKPTRLGTSLDRTISVTSAVPSRLLHHLVNAMTALPPSCLPADTLPPATPAGRRRSVEGSGSRCAPGAGTAPRWPYRRGWSSGRRSRRRGLAP